MRYLFTITLYYKQLLWFKWHPWNGFFFVEKHVSWIVGTKLGVPPPAKTVFECHRRKSFVWPLVNDDFNGLPFKVKGFEPEVISGSIQCQYDTIIGIGAFAIEALHVVIHEPVYILVPVFPKTPNFSFRQALENEGDAINKCEAWQVIGSFGNLILNARQPWTMQSMHRRPGSCQLRESFHRL